MLRNCSNIRKCTWTVCLLKINKDKSYLAHSYLTMVDTLNFYPFGTTKVQNFLQPWGIMFKCISIHLEQVNIVSSTPPVPPGKPFPQHAAFTPQPKHIIFPPQRPKILVLPPPQQTEGGGDFLSHPTTPYWEYETGSMKSLYVV